MFILGFIFSAILGTFGHFIYKWTNIRLFKYLFAHNEKLLAHLKLGITPMIIWAIFEKLVLNDNNIIALNGIGILIFIILISLVYLFGKIIKKEIPVLNISSFYIALFTSYLVTFLLYNIINIPIILIIIGNILFVIYILLYIILSKFY